MDLLTVHMIWLLLFALAGWGLGWITLRIWGSWARRRPAAVQEGERTLRNAFKGILPLWGALAGAWCSMVFFSLTPRGQFVIGQVIFGVFVLSACVLLSRLVLDRLQRHTERLMGETRSASILTILGRVFIFTLGALAILNHLGVSITPMITALGIGGLAVALALQDTLTNLFAGLQLLASDQVNVGDFVRLEQGQEGYVVDITWRNTTIKALSNQLIVVPNAKLASSIIVNQQLPDPAVSVLVEVSVAYESDLEQVEQVTVETARRVMRQQQPGLSEFDPFIRFHTFGDSGIGFTVILRVREFTERYVLMHTFIKSLHRRYNEAGIVIPYPMRTLRFEIPQQVTHE